MPVLQGGPGARTSLRQHMKANMLTAAAADADLPRKVVIAYDSFDVGRQMLTWAAKYCLAADDQLFLLQYQVRQIPMSHEKPLPLLIQFVSDRHFP